MADHESIFRLAEAVVTDLTAAQKTLAVAESCTGGWIAKAITDVPGSSAVFGYGIVSYSNGAKESLLGVASGTLDNHGAVSEPAVREMVAGIVGLSGADFGIAVSGIAGPDGGTPEKPVGTVCFAWAVRTGGSVRFAVNQQQFTGDRELIRELAVVHALQGILDRIQP